VKSLTKERCFFTEQKCGRFTHTHAGTRIKLSAVLGSSVSRDAVQAATSLNAG